MIRFFALPYFCVWYAFLFFNIRIFFYTSVLISFVFSPPSFFPCMLVSGILFLLWGAVPSDPAAWLHLLLWHLLIYWSGERQATGERHRVAVAAHLQHVHNLGDRFVIRCPSLCPYWKYPNISAPVSANPSYTITILPDPHAHDTFLQNVLFFY